MRDLWCAGLVSAVIISTVLCLAAPALAAHGENCVGINTHLVSDDTYEAVAGMGIGWVRIDVNWKDVEPSHGQFWWNEIDRVVNKAGALGLKVFATFAYSPAWASSGNVDGKDSGNDVPKPGLYEAALRVAVKRYRGKVAHWGLWNEANLGGFWEGTAQQYVDLIVKPGADAVHQECPECLTLGPELANVGDKLNEYYDTVFGQAKDKLDIISHHTYQEFPEIDSSAGVFGDSFYNAIEKKRVFSSRMALYEALTKYQITGKDVWITETGYKASPATDAAEMEHQRKYIELALKAQADRAWYTNVFFYEIEDCGIYIPNCDIDGYGILRRTGGPDGTWQDNFTFKPAYQTIKDWMAAHPTWCSGAPPTDGGMPDSGSPDAGKPDAGSADAGTVAQTLLYAMRAPAPVVVDGKLDEWNFRYEAPVTAADYVELTAPTTGDADLSGRVIPMWDDTNLYLAAIITDNVHKNDNLPTDMWMGDSWQIALDVDFDKTPGQYDSDGDYEVGFALLTGGPSSAQWKAAAGAPSWNPTFRTGTDGLGRQVFEIAIPWSQLPPIKPAVGKMIGFAYLINDDDGSGRKGFIEWSTGIGITKDPSKFGILALAGGPCEVDYTCQAAADCAPAQVNCQCGGSWTCNGAHKCEWACGAGDAGQPDTGTQDTGGVADTGTPDDTGTAGDTGTTDDTGMATDGGGQADGTVAQDTGGPVNDSGAPIPADGGGGGGGGSHSDGGKAPTPYSGDSGGGCSCSVLGL